MKLWHDPVLRWFGYSECPAKGSVICRLSWAVSRAVAEAMYPPGQGRWPSAGQARVAEEVEAFMRRLSPVKYALIGCLLWFTELAPMLRPPFRRFSRLTIDQRLRLLNGWENGRIYFLNLCSSSLRMLFNFAYLSDDAVRAEVGETDRAECAESPAPRALRPRDQGRVEGIFEYDELAARSLKLTTDFLVIGTGPGGAVVARELAEAGRAVIALEEGLFYRPEDHAPRAIRTLADIFREQGLRNTRGNVPVRTFQARALGGTSLVNSAICWRAPQAVFDDWSARHGVEGLSREALDPYYERAEREASVGPTEREVWGRKGELFRDGCAGMGVVGRPMRRAMRGCRGCSNCFHGCRIGAKQSMDRCYIPAAIEHGARFYTSCRAEELIVEGGRVAGARGSVVDAAGRRQGRFEVRARATVVSAGVFASPLLLGRSPLPWRSPAIGRNLSFHNGLAVAGVFDEPVNPWTGATQGWDTDAYLEEGIHMEVLWTPSALLTARISGFGEPLRRAIGQLAHTAYWCISIHGSSRGRVGRGPGGEPLARFNVNDADVALLKRGVELLVDHFFAAGARVVRPGLQGFQAELRTPADVAALRAVRPRAAQFVVGGQHVFGTCAMGADPLRSVVDSNLAAHNVPDLYVCDTGVFPAQTSVNPQLTLMAVAGRLAATLDGRY